MLRGAYRGGPAFIPAVPGLVRTTAVVAAAGLVAAGCTTSGMPDLDMPAFDMTASGAAGRNIAAPRTVAFESIDGPPEAIFHRLVARLGEEANARKIAMVSREQAAQYRIRGYVAAHVQDQRTTITWVWDVFSASRERVARFSGEVPGAVSERAWAAADDAVVGRMAQDGMDRLAAFLATPSDAPPAVAVSASQGPMAYLPTRP